MTRNHGTGGTEGRKEKVGDGVKMTRLEKSSYTFRAHTAVCIFTDACTFAPQILESEKDDYLHRDTSSLNWLFYLLIYLPVAHACYVICMPYSSTAMSLAFVFAFSYSHENSFSRA